MNPNPQPDQSERRQVYYVEQLPEIIEHEGRAYILNYHSDASEDAYYVSYISFKPHPNKKVFSHNE